MKVEQYSTQWRKKHRHWAESGLQTVAVGVNSRSESESQSQSERTRGRWLAGLDNGWIFTAAALSSTTTPELTLPDGCTRQTVGTCPLNWSWTAPNSPGWIPPGKQQQQPQLCCRWQLATIAIIITTIFLPAAANWAPANDTQPYLISSFFFVGGGGGGGGGIIIFSIGDNSFRVFFIFFLLVTGKYW